MVVFAGLALGSEVIQEQGESTAQQMNVVSMTFNFVPILCQLDHAVVLEVDQILMVLSSSYLPKGITNLQVHLNRQGSLQIESDFLV